MTTLFKIEDKHTKRQIKHAQKRGGDNPGYEKKTSFNY